MSNKRDLMARLYKPDMTGRQLVEAVRAAGSTVSVSYARNFINGRQSAELRESLGMAERNIWILEESLRSLEFDAQTVGWRVLTTAAAQEFTADGLKTIRELARIMRLKNPIVKRGVKLQQLYVWAQGVTVRASDEQIDTEIQRFMADPQNANELFSHKARSRKEQDLQTDGEIFLVLFPNAKTGDVRIGSVEPDEVAAVICNPENRREHWFYVRTFGQATLAGNIKTVTYIYPDWRFVAKDRNAVEAQLRKVGAYVNIKVQWETPIYPVQENMIGTRGVSEIYDALDWALAYKNFLENLATVWRALAKYAHQITTKGGKRGVEAAKAKLSTKLSQSAPETNPPALPGSTFIASEGTTLQPMKTAGATHSAEDGRRLLLMAVASFGFPETFFGDASVGTVATSQSLNRPTELMVRDRQTLWAGVWGDLFSYFLLWQVKAPQGKLRGAGTVIKTEEGDRVFESVQWDQDVDPTVNTVYPDIVEDDITKRLDALVTATTLNGQAPAGTLTLRKFTELAAAELGLDNVPELIAELFPDGDDGDQVDDLAEAAIALVRRLDESLAESSPAR